MGSKAPVLARIAGRARRSSAQGSDERFVGTEVSLNVTWEISGRLALTAIYSHFRPGAFIRDTGPSRNIDYLEFTAQAKF